MRPSLVMSGSHVYSRVRLALLSLVAVCASLVLGLSSTQAASDQATDSASPSPTSAASPALSLDVRLGYGGMAKIGDWLPVTVQVSNQGGNVSGELQIEVNDTSGGLRRSFYYRPPTIYTVPASLPTQSRKQYQIDVFLPFPTKSLTVKLLTNQGVVIQRTGQLQALSGSDVLCGTLAGNPDYFQQLKNLDLPGRQGKKPFVVALEPQDVPTRSHALSSLDCLIVDNISLAGLTDGQKSAILGWVENGGLLILGGGSGWQKTLQPLPPTLLPVAVNGVKALPTLQPLADFTHQPFPGSGPWIVSSGTLARGRVVAQENGVPLLAGARRGSGAVLYLAADPTTQPFSTWSGNAALWKYMLGYTTTPLAVYPFFNAFGGFSTIQSWGMPPRQAIFNVSGVAPPPETWLAVFLVLYALVAGPLNYLVLRLTGHKALGWMTIPLSIAAGAAITFHVAQGYRGSDLVLNKISLVRSQSNSVQANVRSYISLYSPRKGNFVLDLPGNASVTSFARPAALGSRDNPVARRWQLKVNEGDQVSHVDLPLDVSDTATLFADSQVQLPGKFDTNLRVQGNTISGTIVNHTGQAVDDVVVAMGSHLQALGHMTNGDKRTINLTFDPNKPASGPDAAAVKADLAGGNQRSDATQEDRSSVLDSFLGTNSGERSAGLSGLTLLGWLARSPLPAKVEGLNASVKETNLYAASLPFSFPRHQTITIPPALIMAKQIGSFSTSFQQNGQYELNPSGSLAIEFSLPAEASAMHSGTLVLHMNGRYAGNPRFSRAASRPGGPLGQIFLYDWQSASWQARPLVWGDNVINHPTRYLSATSTLRVRYTYKAPAQQPTASLQFSLDMTDTGQLG